MAINLLPLVEALAAGDQVPLYSQDGGGDRRVPLSKLAELLQTMLQAAGQLQTQYAAPNATGFTATVAPTEAGGSVFLLLAPQAGYAAGTIALPALIACVDGQEVLVHCTQAVTALTVDGNGATVNGAPTTLAAKAFFRLRFDKITASWYRVS